MNKFKAIKMFEKGAFTDHETICRLNEEVRDLNTLPEPWKQKVQEYRKQLEEGLAAGKKLITFSITA